MQVNLAVTQTHQQGQQPLSRIDANYVAMASMASMANLKGD
jgi:hypothetical protein